MILLFSAQLVVCYLYLLVISWITNQWDEVEEVLIPKDYISKNSFSIIVPYRNEIENLGPCIESILSMKDGPVYELITVNDHSTDKSDAIAKTFHGSFISHLDSPYTGKKGAITAGIQKAKFTYIITLDADCIVDKDWLRLIDQSIVNSNIDVLVGPVKFIEDNSFLTRFQMMDAAATMTTTAAGIKSGLFQICNGANFTYKKDLFQKANGFQGNDHIPSGDDVFLLQKFSNFENVEIGYLKSKRGAVTTISENSWRNLFQQRKRWATKTMAYANKYILLLQSFIFGVSILVLANFIILPLFIGEGAIIIGLFVLFIKGVIDYLFLNKFTKFFGGKKVMKSFIPAFISFHFFYIIIALQAVFPSKAMWKKRRV